MAAGVTATAYVLVAHDRSYARPDGIPASIPDSQVNLMELSPIPARPAPGFTLTDQDGQVLPLSAVRGKVVVLEFMDPHCTDSCPIVSAEYVDAYHGPGKLAGQVAFAAVNVNQYHTAVAGVAAFSREHQPPRPSLTSPATRPASSTARSSMWTAAATRHISAPAGSRRFPLSSVPSSDVRASALSRMRGGAGRRRRDAAPQESSPQAATISARRLFPHSAAGLAQIRSVASIIDAILVAARGTRPCQRDPVKRQLGCW